MPYIPEYKRSMAEDHPDSSGELNYAITTLLIRYLERNALCYATINDIVGAVEGAKLEFYRRVVAPYEESKIKQNGDVYPEQMILKD